MSCNVGWNYLSITKLQQCNRWSLGMDKLFHPTVYNGCNYLSMLGLMLNPVSKSGPQKISHTASSPWVSWPVPFWSSIEKKMTYHQTSDIKQTKFRTLDVSHLILLSSCLWPIHWSQVLSWEWRCRSNAERWSNYIWVINNFSTH